MSLTSGTKLGPYEIVAPLGAGGMGEVYRARDSRLKREVAVKVLPHAFSLDADRLRRFEQEALATAALNHPNILAVFDIGTNDGSPYVVSELLEGETLRDRLRGGAIAVRKTLDYVVEEGFDLFVQWLNPGRSDSGENYDRLGLMPWLLGHNATVSMRDGKIPPFRRTEEIRQFIHGWAKARWLTFACP